MLVDLLDHGHASCYLLCSFVNGISGDMKVVHGHGLWLLHAISSLPWISTMSRNYCLFPSFEMDARQIAVELSRCCVSIRFMTSLTDSLSMRTSAASISTGPDENRKPCIDSARTEQISPLISLLQSGHHQRWASKAERSGRSGVQRLGLDFPFQANGDDRRLPGSCLLHEACFWDLYDSPFWPENKKL
jgi:hypothetical protein